MKINIYIWNNAWSAYTLLAWKSESSHYLKTTNFGFNFDHNQEIVGIEIQIEVSKTGSGLIFDDKVRLIKGGVIQGEDKPATTGWPAGGDTVLDHGGPTDLWGLEWTPEDINASDFGCVVSAKETSGTDAADARIDRVLLIIYRRQRSTIPGLATVRTAFRTLSVVEASVPTLTPAQLFVKVLSVVEASVVDLSAGFLQVATLTVSAVSVATLGAVQLILRTLAATAGSTATIVRVLSYFRTLTVIEVSVVTLSRVNSFFKTLTATAVSSAVLVASETVTFFQTLAATAGSTAVLAVVATVVRTLSVVEISVVTLSTLSRNSFFSL